MGILNWFDGKLNDKLADMCDKELAVCRAVIGDRTDLAEHFFEAFIAAQRNVYELVGATGSDSRSYALAITHEIKLMRGDRRTNASSDVLRAAVSLVKSDPVASSAYKMLASWMSLVEAESGSKKPNFRAHNLVTAYENELSRLLELLRPR